MSSIDLLNELLSEHGMSDQIPILSALWQFTGGLNGFASLTQQQLQNIEGMTPALLTRLSALAEIFRRIQHGMPSEHTIIRSAHDAAQLLDDMRGLTQEHVRVILLDAHHQVMGIVTVYIGTLNTSLVRAAEIFREAILRNCAGVIVAHNHPTGNPQPSPEDVHMSRGLSAAGKLLDIPLHDHLIIGRDSWVSLKELGLLQA